MPIATRFRRAVRLAFVIAVFSVVSAASTRAVVVNVPSSCDVGGSPPCSCTGFVCSPNAAISQLAFDAPGYTFDCSIGGFAIGGTSEAARAPDPLVDIAVSQTTLKNCTVQHGLGRGVSAHNTNDVTLLDNNIFDTTTEAIAAFQVGSSSGAGGTGVVITRNVVSKTRNVASGPGDNAVGLYSLTAGSNLMCNVISSQSNGVTNNGNSTMHSQCNAFLQYGTRYVSTNFSPIAELSEQGSGMHSEYDCVVTFGDTTNPLIPTRCRADGAWNTTCSALLSGTCLNPLAAFGSFSLPVSSSNRDEDGDGVVDWRDVSPSDGKADTDTFGIGCIGRNGNASNTTVEHAVLLGVQRALWASAVLPTYSHHTVSFHDNKVVSIGGPFLNGVGVLVQNADGLTVTDNTVVGSNFGIVTDNAAQTGYPIEIAENQVRSSLSWPAASSFGAIQLQRTKFMTKAENRIHDNVVSSWSGYGIALLGGAAGAGVSIFSNHLTDVSSIAFDFEGLDGTDPLDVEIRNNDATIVAGPTTDTEGFYLSPASGSSLSIHDNEITARTMFDRVNDSYASFRVYHNVFHPTGTSPKQTEGTANLHLITDTITAEGNNWDTHCSPAIASPWSDVPAGTLSPATVDPHAYEGTASIDRPWDSSYLPGCFGTRPITAVSQTTAPTPSGSGSGSTVRNCGDVDRDGMPDQCVGAPEHSQLAFAAFGGPSDDESGAVFVYFGSTNAAERAQPDIVFTGVDAHDRAGVAVAGNFDFNGDGHPDIVIGAEQYDLTTDPENPTPTGNGKVYVIFFDPTDTTHYPNIADPDVPDFVSLSLVGQPGGIPGIVFEGVAFGDRAGFSLDAGGTSTPSVATDIVIGAPGADPGGRTDAGAVYVVFDSPTLSGTIPLTRISDGLPDEVPGKAYYGDTAGDSLGFSTAFGGSVVEEQDPLTGTVLMGAPTASGFTGKVVAAPGDPDTTPIIVDAIGTTSSGFQIVGTQTGEQLGFAVADGGDALADGISDVLIGAPTYDVGGQTDAGRVVQTTAIIPTGIYGADAVGTSIDGVLWTGEAAGDQLGFAVAGVSDVTGDGLDDVVFGAPFVDPVVGGVTQQDAGAVYLINGQAVTGTLGIHSVAEVGTTVAGQEFTGTQAGEHTGSSVDGLGDFSGDGTNDFAVGAPDHDNDAGGVYMVLQATPPPVGECGPSGCSVADFVTGAQVDVPPGGLPATITLTAQGVLDASGLPAPVPAGKMLYGAALFAPDGQPVLPPFATIHIPTVGEFAGQFAPSEVLPLYYYDGSGWVAAGVNGTTAVNPTHPTQLEVVATVGVLHLYAVFVNDADGDTIRDELDNCPLTPNTGQLDTNDDGVGDACQCLNANCSDGNVCTTDSCVATTGCLHTNNAVSCDDGNPCTTADVCGSGVCAGVTITEPPETLDLAADPDKVRITWSAATYATSYDVVSGAIRFGGVLLAAATCLASVPDAFFDDPRGTPEPRTGFWYLVRGHNSCGAGTYGTTERDTSIPPCP